MQFFNRARYITLTACCMTIFLLYTQNAPMDDTTDSFDYLFEPSCSCKTCVMGLLDDDWFVYRYDPTIPPLLNRKNSVLHGDTNKWWRVSL